MAKFTEEELAMLTEDERREIEELGDEYDEDNEDPPMDPDDDPDDDAGEEDDADEADPDADDNAADDSGDDAKAGDDDKPDADPDADAGGDDDAAKDEGGEGDGKPDKTVEPQQQAPLLDAQMPEGYEEKINEFESKREQLDTDFDDGELTSLEYRQQLRDIEKEERDLRDQAFKAQISQEMQESQQKTAWQQTVNAFLDDNDVYKQSRALYRELNDTVIEIANSEEAAKMTGQEILAAAHDRVSSDPALSSVFKQKQAADKGGDDKADDKPKDDADGKDKKDAKGNKKPLERRKVPPTLANVPASDMSEAEEGSRFAKLDKMDGLELERELNRLSSTNPKLVDEYLSR